MKKTNLFLIISLLLAPIVFFLASHFVFAKTATGIEQANTTLKPYLVEEIKAGGAVVRHQGESAAKQTDQIVGDLGIELISEDKLSAFPDIDMGMGSKITIYRAPRYIVYDANKKNIFYSWANNVAELLKEKKVQLARDDRINFSSDTDLEPEMTIRITRVKKSILVEEEDVDFEVIKKEDPEMEKGKTVVEQYGEKGTLERHFEVVRENGEEIRRTLVKKEVVKDPRDEIKIYGTKVVSYGSGVASWYEASYMNSQPLVAACRDVPKGTYVNVVNEANGRSVRVKVVDWIGHRGRIIDLSPEAFSRLAPLGQGIIGSVRLEKTY